MILEINRKKLFLFGSFIVVMLAIPITVYLTGQRQDQRSQASEVPDTTVVAVIDGAQITKGDVRLVAEESYEAVDVNDQVLEDALLIIEERKILDKAMSDYEIQIDQEWVDELIADGYSEDEAYYLVLKNQVTLKAVNSVSAYTIQFWNTPESGLASLTEEERTLAVTQLRDGQAALNRAQALMARSDDMIEIGDTVLSEYPSLKPVLAVNGYILDGLAESERILAKRPQVFEKGNSGLDPTTYEVVFNLGDGLSRSVNTETNRGGIIFKPVTINETGADTYDQWYAGQKADLVRSLNVL